VVVPGVTGLLVPPQRPDQLAGAIGYLLDSPADAARMAAAARARLGDRFGVPALAEALAAAYLGGPAVTSPEPPLAPPGT
jgi:glycosyltransferase involved in cell wall biosynthesis